jgi:hypothetical protein
MFLYDRATKNQKGRNIIKRQGTDWHTFLLFSLCFLLASFFFLPRSFNRFVKSTEMFAFCVKRRRRICALHCLLFWAKLRKTKQRPITRKNVQKGSHPVETTCCTCNKFYSAVCFNIRRVLNDKRRKERKEKKKKSDVKQIIMQMGHDGYTGNSFHGGSRRCRADRGNNNNNLKKK